MSPAAAQAGAVATTQRLRLRRFTLDDAEFIVELVNDPGWLRFIGDKKVATAEDARRYLEGGPLKLYERHGFGLWLMERLSDGAPVGMCGLVKRETLEDVDVGFALLERHRGQGYALEAAKATLAVARDRYGIRRIVAITSPDNASSAALLARLGFTEERSLEIGPGDQVRLFGANL